MTDRIAAPAKTLHLLIPGLLPIIAGGETEGAVPPSFPASERLLARADALRDIPAGFDNVLFSLFQVQTPAEGDLPVAAVTRVLDMGVIDNGWWLRADPVHLRPVRDRLILLDASLLDIAQDEANQLVAEITEVYKPDGWVLKAPRPGRWYLKPPRPPKMVTTPLPEVAGRDIHPYLPQGRDGKVWHTVLNEIQILLHSAKVNEERERHGKLPINSLWFWGGGRLPRIQPVSWAEVWSGEPVSLALARLSERPSRTVPSGFEEWHKLAERPGEHLAVIDDLRLPAQYGDFEAWGREMEGLERRWMVPLLGSLKAGTLAATALLTDTGQRFFLTPRHARRWWRRRRSLASYR